MIVDSSALLGIAFKEPGWWLVLDRITAGAYVGIGTPTLAETGALLGARLGRDAEGLVDRMRYEFDLIEIEFGDRHWRETLSAYWRFGRGRHEAGLDLGDCFSYAVARLAHEPLLYLGGGFSLTDIRAA